MTLTLSALDGRFAVCRLDAAADVPDWASGAGSFVSITRTADELSVVCAADAVPEGVTAARDWRGLRVEGPLDFALTGVLASLAGPLAEAGVSVFVINTYDTDYVFVREGALGRAVEALERAGHHVRG